MKSISCITTLFFTLLCLSFLSGCGAGASDPSPSVSKTIFLETGESVHFSVKGDEPFTGPGDNALIYEWTAYKFGNVSSGKIELGDGVLDADYLAIKGDEQYSFINVTLIVTRKVEQTPGFVKVTKSTFRWEIKVGTSLQVAPEWKGTFYYHNSNDLDSLVGFNSVSESLVINSTYASVLPDLKHIKHVGENLSVSYNKRLKDFSGLGVETIGGWLKINSNYSLKTLLGLESLKAVGGGVEILENVQLENVDGLNNIELVGDGVTIKKNSQLENIQGLEGLNTVGGTLRLDHNDKLKSLKGVGNIQSLGGIYIYDNDLLTSIEEFEGITSLSEDLYIRYNPALVSLNGLENITMVQGDLRIMSSPLFTSLQGLDAIASVGGSLEIYHNNKVETFEALSQLLSIGETLEIHFNDGVSDLNGFQGLEAIGGDFRVHENEALCQEIVEALEQQVIAANGIGGESQIDTNNGCL